jgi:5-oxoprolinase (ATP-hydrolysing) subunit A
LMLFGLPGSALLEAGRAHGLRVAAEGFADRAYNADGSLVSRSLADSVIHDEARVVARTVQMARDGTVATATGEIIRLDVETVCVHGDTRGAAQLAAAIRRALETEGVGVNAIGAN